MISGGYNIYPKEVETEIDQMRGSWKRQSSRAASETSAKASRRVVVRNPGATIDERSILDGLGRPAGALQATRNGVIFVDDLPRNAMGKVQKNVLRETYARLYAGAEARA